MTILKMAHNYKLDNMIIIVYYWGHPYGHLYVVCFCFRHKTLINGGWAS